MSQEGYNQLFLGDRSGTLGAGFLPSNMSAATYPGQTLLAMPVGLAYPIKEDYRDEDEWYKAFVRYCVTKAVPTFRRRESMYRMALDLYSQVSQFSKIPGYGRTPDDAALSPVEYEFINAFAPIINVKQGEFSSNEYKVEARVSNSRAFSRKAEYIKGLLLDKMMYDISPDVFELMGQQPNNINAMQAMLQYEGSVNEFVEETYRDVYADIAERMLTDWMQESNFNEWLSQTYKYYQLTETAIATPYIDERTYQVVNPLVRPDAFIPDPMPRDNFFETANFWIQFQYESLESIRLRYPEIPVEELKKLIGARRNFYGLPSWREDADGRFYVIVMHVEFKYPEFSKYVEELEVGTELKAEENEEGIFIWEEPIIERLEHAESYEELYFVDLVGGIYIADKGPVRFQSRSSIDPYKANLSAEVVVYDYSISPFIPNSSVRIGALINYRNYSLFKLLKIISKLESSKVIIDPRIIPDFDEAANKNEAFAQWWENIKENNIVFRDDRETSMMPSQNVSPIEVQNISQADMPIIAGLVEAIQFIDQQIERFMGFSPARTGNISKYAAASNVKQELTQSDYATADLRNTFERFVERVLSKIANLLKTAIVAVREKAKAGDINAQKHLEVMAMRYGESALTVETDFIFEDIGIKIKRRVNDDALRNDYREIGMLVIQQKADPDAAEAVMSMMEAYDAREMKQEFSRMIQSQRKRMEEARQAQMMQEQQMMAAQEQASMQGASQAQLDIHQMDMEKEGLRQQGENARAALKAQTQAEIARRNRTSRKG